MLFRSFRPKTGVRISRERRIHSVHVVVCCKHQPASGPKDPAGFFARPRYARQGRSLFFPFSASTTSLPNQRAGSHFRAVIVSAAEVGSR